MSDLTEYLPQPSTWFSKTLSYTGIGRIELSNPKGWIEGDMTCEVNHVGDMKVFLKVKKWENYEEIDEPESGDALYWLTSGVKPHKLGSMSIRIGIPAQRFNFITALNLQTIHNGELVFEDIYDYTFNEGENLITIYPNRATYIEKDQVKSNAKYWVLPCVNLNLVSFGSTPAYLYSDLRQHPLRIFPITSKTHEFLASEASIEDKGWVEHHITGMSYIVAFLYHNKPAFIERLPDYYETITALKDGLSRLAVTSVMVGECHPERDNDDPANLLAVLGLATGRPVGASWIEFRDKDGNLVYRFHANFGRYNYGRGRTTVNDSIHRGGLGKLLTEASQSTEINNSLIRGALRNFAEGVSGEDSTAIFYNIFTALDGLFNYYNVDDMINSPKLSLTKHQIDDIESILKKAQNDIRHLKAKISPLSVDKEKQFDSLNKIANNISGQAFNKRNNFGDKLFALIEHLGFSDIKVLSNYYTDIEEWISTVTQYRNITMHNTHYENIFSPKTKQSFEQLLPHLIDILIRILLKTIGYTGNYAPFMKAPNYDEELGWVKIDPNDPDESTSPKDLGYK